VSGEVCVDRFLLAMFIIEKFTLPEEMSASTATKMMNETFRDHPELTQPDVFDHKRRKEWDELQSLLSKAMKSTCGFPFYDLSFFSHFRSLDKQKLIDIVRNIHVVSL
jgi:hypothetical protein